LRGFDRRGRIAPTAAHKTEDLGDFIILQPGKAGHGVHPRVRRCLRGFPAGQGDMQQGGRVGRHNARVAIQWREHTWDPTAVRAMTVGAELRVTQAATTAVERIRRPGRRQRYGRHRQVILARGQRFQIAGDGRQVGIGKVLGTVVDDIGHIARHRGKAVLPGLEQLHGVFHCPQVAQAQGTPLFDGFTGQVMLAGAARVAHGLFLKGDATRRVA